MKKRLKSLMGSHQFWFLFFAIILFVALIWFAGNNFNFIASNLNRAFDFDVVHQPSGLPMDFDVETFEKLNIPLRTLPPAEETPQEIDTGTETPLPIDEMREG